MMGSLMDEMLATWSHNRLAISQSKAKMVELDVVITHRDIMAIWKRLALGLDSLDTGGSGNVSITPSC